MALIAITVMRWYIAGDRTIFLLPLYQLLAASALRNVEATDLTVALSISTKGYLRSEAMLNLDKCQIYSSHIF